MAVSQTTRLAEAAAELREMERALSGPGPLAPALAQARRPEVWVGTVAEAFAAELEFKDVYLKQRLAPALGTVAGWMERRATEIEDQARISAAGLTAPPLPAPGPLRTGGPGPIGPYEPYRGPVHGFAGLEPKGVWELCGRLQNAQFEFEDYGRRVKSLVEDLALMLPPDVAEAVGVPAFGDMPGWLEQAARNLFERAQRVEVSQAVGALFGAPVSTLEDLLRHRPQTPAGPPPEAAGSPSEQGRADRIRYEDLRRRWAAGDTSVAEEMMAIQDRVATDAEYRAGYEEDALRRVEAGRTAGSELGCLVGAGLKKGDREHARHLLADACARNDVDFAAGFVNGLGPEHLKDLLDDRLRESLGCVLGAASRSAHLDFNAKPLLLEHDDWDEVADVLGRGAFDPQRSIDVAAPVLLKKDGSDKHLKRYARALELLGRDRDTALAAATDPRIGERVTDMLGATPGLFGDPEGLNARIAVAAHNVLRLGLIPPPTAEPALTEARKAMDRVIRGPRTDISSLLVADFVAVNISDLAELAGKDAGAQLEAGKLSLTRAELEDTLQYLAHDPEARQQVLAAATAQLTGLVAGSVALIGQRMAEVTTLEDAKRMAEQIARQQGEPLRMVGELYGMISKANLAVLDDRKAAAREIAATVGVVAKALFGTAKVPGDVTGQLIDPLTKALEDRLVQNAVGDDDELKKEIDETLTTVTALSLYNQKDAYGHYVIRARMKQLGMKSPPWGEPPGDLVLPEPFTAEARKQLMGWLQPDGVKPLYEMAHAFVAAPGALADTFESAVVTDLNQREANA